MFGKTIIFEGYAIPISDQPQVGDVVINKLAYLVKETWLQDGDRYIYMEAANPFVYWQEYMDALRFRFGKTPVG